MDSPRKLRPSFTNITRALLVCRFSLTHHQNLPNFSSNLHPTFLTVDTGEFEKVHNWEYAVQNEAIYKFLLCTNCIPNFHAFISKTIPFADFTVIGVNVNVMHMGILFSNEFTVCLAPQCVPNSEIILLGITGSNTLIITGQDQKGLGGVLYFYEFWY